MQSKMQTSSSEYVGFVKAFGTYNRYRRSVRHILKDTSRLLIQANAENDVCGFNSQKHFLNEEESILLRNTVSNSLTYIVLGQSYEAKCMLINKMLGQKIIPLDTDWVKLKRTVVFKYGPQPQLTVSLPDSFLLIEPELEVNGDNIEDNLGWKKEFIILEHDMKTETNSLVEISLHHPLLKGSKVVLCAEFDSESMKNNLFSFVNGNMPLFLYALKQLPLTKTDKLQLNLLKQEFSGSVIFFTHLSSAASTVNGNCKFGNSDCLNGYRESLKNQSTVTINLNNKENQELNNSDVIVPRRHTIDSIDTKNHLLPTDLLCNNKILCNTDTALNSSLDANGMFKKLSTANGGGKDYSISTQSSPGEFCIMHSEISCKCLRELTELFYTNFECTCKKYSFKSAREKLKSPTLKISPVYINCNKTAGTDVRLSNLSLKCVFTPSKDYRFFARLLTFTRNIAKYYLIRAAKVLHNFHSNMLNDTIDFAFDLNRDLTVTPKRVEYVRQKEFQLYNQLNEIIAQNQASIQTIIENAKVELHENLLNAAQSWKSLNKHGNAQSIKLEIQDMVLLEIKSYTAEKIHKSVQILRESFVGTLLRCLKCLESSPNGIFSPNEGEDCASKHFKKIINTAYNVEITVQSSSSVVSIVIDKLRQMLTDLSTHHTPVIDDIWKRNTAEEALRNLSPNRLAKNICNQYQAKLNQSHSAFLNALKHLELAHKCRLDNMECNRHKLSRIIVPTIAKLALESTSLIDGVLYGMPRIEREIGRGMYGVVYSCGGWGELTNCAVKSVAPPDEKHFNDLSLEFYYTSRLPKHPRVVQIHGSVIDESYNSGIGPPAVLLIMDRLHRDLYTSIKVGMSLCERLQVSVDVVEGIRFLHSQGLVHRDIKLKNVLLDHKGRAKITDLGFCKPGAMISGSIVGTPIHMPPELFTGNYSFSVDVYAFGILMWYLMAGTTKLPKNFELYTTKDHLWTAVRKGIRPERLPEFSDETWDLMQACWSRYPRDRPLLGTIEPQLRVLHAKSLHFSP